MAKSKGSTKTAKAIKTEKVEDKPQNVAKAPEEKVPEEHRRVVIEGRARRFQTFNLPHEIYCEAMGKCFCTEGERVVSFKSPEDKQRHTKVEKVRHCSNFSVRFKERVSIAKAALLCPEVDAALRQKRLRLRS